MQRYDPELLAVLQTFPSMSLVNWDDLPATRQATGEMLKMMMADSPDSPNVSKEDRLVPGPEGAHKFLFAYIDPGRVLEYCQSCSGFMAVGISWAALSRTILRCSTL